MNDRKEFLTSTQYLNWKSDPIQQQVQRIFPNQKNLTNVEKAIRIFNFVRDKIDYRIPDSFLTKKYLIASNVLQQGYGNCVQKSLVLASLGRALQIPTRLHFADLINHLAPSNYIKKWGTKLAWHGYVDIFLNDQWFAANPDYSSDLCKKKGYPIVYFDGKHDALLPARDKQGNPFIEYTADHGWFKDLPKLRMQWHYFKTYFPPYLKYLLWKKKT